MHHVADIAEMVLLELAERVWDFENDRPLHVCMSKGMELRLRQAIESQRRVSGIEQPHGQNAVLPVTAYVKNGSSES